VPQWIFELACIAVIVLTLLAMARTRPVAELLRDYATLAIAGWIGEQTCITGYAFYGYAPRWHGFAGVVPVLVPLIWPLVILSARQVVAALWPGLAGWRRALVLGTLVVVDASLVEIVAVRAGLWSWAEPGYEAVPIIGILGWGFFAAGADLARAVPGVRGSVLAIALGPAVAHLLILASWWALFRWTLRGAFDGSGTVVVAVLGLGAALVAVQLRRAGRAMELAVAAPRIAAALLFVALLVSTGTASAAPFWIHAAAVAVPYLVATRFAGLTAGTRWPATPRAPTAPSPR
jgi:hypothetical protein